MGGSVGKLVSNIGGAIGDVAGAVGDVVQDVVDPVSEALANFEDGVRNVVEPLVEAVDDAIANPYVRLVASIAYPPAAPYLNAYAKLDSGENLTAADIAALGASAVTDLGTLEIDPEIAKAVQTGAKIADGADPIEVLASAYGESFVKDLGFEEKVIQGLGEDTYNLVKDNMDIARAGYDIATGKDPSQVLADRFGDQIVGALGSDDPSVNALGYAGLKTAVGLDQGLDTEEALFEGAKEYRDRGGEFAEVNFQPNLQSIGSIAGIDLSGFNPDFSFIKDYAQEFTGLDTPDLAYIEDFIRENAPNVSIGSLDFSGLNALDLGINDLNTLAKSGINLEGVDISGIEVPDIDFSLQNPFMMGGGEQTLLGNEDIFVAKNDEDVQETEEEEDTPISQMLLGDVALKNPLLKA